MAGKVAVVTESSDGLGFSVVKGLCLKFKGSVYLTSKSAIGGAEAVEKLKEFGVVAFHLLDVSDRRSVESFALFLKEKHGGLDVLVNNVPSFEKHTEYPDYDTAKRTIDVNYRSLLTIEEVLFPLLRDGARVINISSACGHLSNLRNQSWIDRLKNPDLTTDELNDFVQEYLDSVKDGNFEKSNFAGEGKYADEKVAKIAVAALTMIQQRAYDQSNISINVVHPGSPRNRGKAPDDAAKNVLYLALDASPKLKGTFMWHDGKLVDWCDAEDDECLHCCDG